MLSDAHLVLMSAPFSNKNSALALSCRMMALCSNAKPSDVFTSILTPVSKSRAATWSWEVLSASSKAVWSSLSAKLKSGTMLSRPPRPRLSDNERQTDLLINKIPTTENLPYEPDPQSCAVGKNEIFWCATGQSNLADRRLTATKTSNTHTLALCPVVRPNISFLATAHDCESGLFVFWQSRTQSLLASYSACSTKTKGSGKDWF